MLGKVKIATPTQDDTKRVIARLGELGIESFEVRGGLKIHMTKDSAEMVANALAELGLHAANVRSDLLDIIHRKPAEALIREMQDLEPQEGA